MDNTTTYGNNYDNKDTLGIQQNQYLNRVYLTTKEGVYLQHHQIFAINEGPVEVPDDTLVMDLNNGQISLLRLYSPQLFPPDQPCDLKLSAYHISYSKELVAFFFIQRNKDKQSGMYNT